MDMFISMGIWKISPQDGQFEYRVYTKGKSLNPKKLFKLDVTDFNRGAGMSDLHLSQASKENVEKSSGVTLVSELNPIKNLDKKTLLLNKPGEKLNEIFASAG